MAFTQEERPLNDLFHVLMEEVKCLFQQETQLFKVEMSQKASQAGKNFAVIAIGGAAAFAGLLVLLASATLALALVIPAWASALLIGLAGIGVGYALLQKGLSDLKRIQITPEQTIESLKETKEWTTHAIN